MNRSKLVAIITGVISILLAIAYLIIVQLLDLRGEMIPAPVSHLSPGVDVALGHSIQMSSKVRPATLTSPSLSPWLGERGGLEL